MCEWKFDIASVANACQVLAGIGVRDKWCWWLPSFTYFVYEQVSQHCIVISSLNLGCSLLTCFTLQSKLHGYQATSLADSTAVELLTFLLKKNPERVDLTLPEVAHKALLRNYSSKANQVRTAYEKILPKLFDVFAADEIGVFFYENLFSMDTYQSICDFLCLAPAVPSFDVVRNTSTYIEKPSTEIQREIVQGYRGTYEYMRNAFPIVRSLWSDSLLLLD